MNTASRILARLGLMRPLKSGRSLLRGLVRPRQPLRTPSIPDRENLDPSSRVPSAIKRRIENDRLKGRISDNRWERLRFWQGLSAAATATALVLALTTTFLMLRSPVATSANYVAILQDKAARPALILTVYKSPSWHLNIETLAAPNLGAGQVLQVWAVEKDSGAMRPLVAFSPGALQTVALKEREWKLVKTARSFTVSIEPDGVAPANPTTPVLYSGPCIKALKTETETTGKPMYDAIPTARNSV